MSYSYKLITKNKPTGDHGTWATKNGQGSKSKNGKKVQQIQIGEGVARQRGREIVDERYKPTFYIFF